MTCISLGSATWTQYFLFESSIKTHKYFENMIDFAEKS